VKKDTALEPFFGQKGTKADIANGVRLHVAKETANRVIIRETGRLARISKCVSCYSVICRSRVYQTNSTLPPKFLENLSLAICSYYTGARIT